MIGTISSKVCVYRASSYAMTIFTGWNAPTNGCEAANHSSGSVVSVTEAFHVVAAPAIGFIQARLQPRRVGRDVRLLSSESVRLTKRIVARRESREFTPSLTLDIRQGVI